jgi:hypothetical protein
MQVFFDHRHVCIEEVISKKWYLISKPATGIDMNKKINKL